MVIGYTTGVFDLFHYGHVRLLSRAKRMCDKLIVGVTTDELVSYKGKTAFLPFEDRLEVVQACRYVDVALPQSDMDKLTAVKKYNAQFLFVGDDWYLHPKWESFQYELSQVNCSVIYFPYTSSISSTKINNALNQLRSPSATK